MPATAQDPSAPIITCDLLASDAFQAIANPVNCVGTMGAGLARQFAKRYPEILPPYRTACRTGKLRPGQVLLHRLRQDHHPHYVVNFPTKDHFNGSSRLTWIEQGLRDMYPKLEEEGITTLALPALGTGDDGTAGWIEFGRPYWDFQIRAEPETRLIEPEEGLMLLFPSYMFHRTLPFAGAGERISIAFDVLRGE